MYRQGVTASLSCGAAGTMARKVFDEMPNRGKARRLQFWIPSYGVVENECVIAWALTRTGTAHSCSANGVRMMGAKLERGRLAKEKAARALALQHKAIASVTIKGS